MKKVLITGVNGQDGSYLSEYLLDLGYEVHGILRRHSVTENQNSRLVKHNVDDRVKTYYGDLTDPVNGRDVTVEFKNNQSSNAR